MTARTKKTQSPVPIKDLSMASKATKISSLPTQFRTSSRQPKRPQSLLTIWKKRTSAKCPSTFKKSSKTSKTSTKWSRTCMSSITNKSTIFFIEDNASQKSKWRHWERDWSESGTRSTLSTRSLRMSELSIPLGWRLKSLAWKRNYPRLRPASRNSTSCTFLLTNDKKTWFDVNSDLWNLSFLLLLLGGLIRFTSFRFN